VAGSFAAGWVVALLLAVAPFVPAEVPRVTGALLCGYALGWAMLAVLSVRFTEQPQRWAWALAAFMGAGGLLLLSFGSSVMGALAWVWPPVLLVLVVWAWVQVRRRLNSRSRPLLVYPLLLVLALASVGGAYQVLGARADAKAYPMPGDLVDIGGRDTDGASSAWCWGALFEHGVDCAGCRPTDSSVRVRRGRPGMERAG
jgi:hypothetical protein